MTANLAFVLGLAFSFLGVVGAEPDGPVVFISGDLPRGKGPVVNFYTNSRLDELLRSMEPEEAVVPVPSSLLVKSDLPQVWDFTKGPTNFIETVSVMPAAELPAQIRSRFPAATHADRFTSCYDGSDACTQWQVYATVPGGNGRSYLGFATANDADPIVFDQATVDLPATIRFKQTWDREVSFVSTISIFDFANGFFAHSEADGYGEVILPDIGRLPALRVHEYHEWYIDLLGGTPLPIYYTETIFWLVPGLGSVVEIYFPPVIFQPEQTPAKASVLKRAFRLTDDPGRYSVMEVTGVATGDQAIELRAAGTPGEFVYLIQQTNELPVPGEGGGTKPHWNTVATSRMGTNRVGISESRQQFFRVQRIKAADF